MEAAEASSLEDRMSLMRKEVRGLDKWLIVVGGWGARASFCTDRKTPSAGAESAPTTRAGWDSIFDRV